MDNLTKRTISIQSQKLEIAGDGQCSYFKALPAVYAEHDSLFALFKRINFAPATVVDVGANIGLFSLKAALSFPQASIYAYEPHPKAFAALEFNAKKLSQKLNAINLALGETEGQKRFFPGGPINSTRSSGAHFMNESHWKNEQEGISVRASTLDKEVEQRGLAQVDLIKIDVEGFEMEVLKGGAQTWQRDNCLIYVEFNSWTLMAIRNINPRDFLEYLSRNFLYIYRCNQDNSFTPVRTDEDQIKFLHDNLLKFGCVNDLLVSNARLLAKL